MGERGSWVCDVDWAAGALSMALRRAFGARHRNRATERAPAASKTSVDPGSRTINLIAVWSCAVDVHGTVTT